jgi:hypothetical protein
MNDSKLWSKILGWRVGDFLSYYYTPSFKGRKGVWLNLRITAISNNYDYVHVEVINPKRYLGYSPFSLRLGYVESNYPEHIRDYHPRKRTVKKLEHKRKP